MSTVDEDRRLAHSYIEGDSAAFRTVEKYIDSAFSTWQRKMAGEKDDIKSDVHYKLLISLRRSEFGFQASLRTYVSRIVNHTCIDYLRFRKKFSDTDIDNLNLPDQVLSEEEQLEKRQLSRVVFRVLRLVPRQCLQLWRMNLKQGLTCAKIGQIMGMSEGNIRRRLWVCRQKAKEIREKVLRNDKLF